MFENDLGIDIGAYDSSIDTSDGTLGLDASGVAFLVAASDEDRAPLAALAPTADLET